MGYLIAYLALTAFSIGWPEYLSSVGNKYSKELNNIVKDIYSKMQSNNTFYENILNAYNDKKGDLMTSVMMSNGFGSRINRLKQAMAENQQTFNDNKAKYDAKAAELSSKLTKTQDAMSKLGTIAGNKNAEEYIKENVFNNQNNLVGPIKDKVTIGINQAVEGGLKG